MAAPDHVVDLFAKLERLDTPWSPRVVAEMNDYQFKLAMFRDAFVWHRHEETDEVFVVLRGSMGIEMRDRTVHLKEGELFVVPRGVEHRPFSERDCHVLLIEPRGVVNTGDAGGDRTAENDVWI